MHTLLLSQNSSCMPRIQDSYGIEATIFDAVSTPLSPMPPYKNKDPETTTWHCTLNCLHASLPSLIPVRTTEFRSNKRLGNDTSHYLQFSSQKASSME